MKTPLKDETVHDKLAAFLLAYRNAPHSTTGESPATLFLGRSLKSRLDLAVLDLGFDQGGGIPHQAEKGGGIWQLGGGVL